MDIISVQEEVESKARGRQDYETYILSGEVILGCQLHGLNGLNYCIDILILFLFLLHALTLFLSSSPTFSTEILTAFSIFSNKPKLSSDFSGQV